jgi:hypothetical protein
MRRLFQDPYLILPGAVDTGSCIVLYCTVPQLQAYVRAQVPLQGLDLGSLEALRGPYYS